jgi:UDP-N-acetylglucosamine 2-epimerase (non-hydrolysing)
LHRVLSVVGTRPEAIKMAPLVSLLAAEAGLDARVCVTAQHREMVDGVLAVFGIEAAYDLDLMRPGRSLNDLTAAVLTGLKPVLDQFAPHLVLVHGDTSTTFAAALAACYAHVPVGHVEAGLRSGDMLSPWPEEANRKLTDSIATLHFAPTERARLNLLAENVPHGRIHVTGNTAIDALHATLAMLDAAPALGASIDRQVKLDPARHLVLVTAHRRETFGDGIHRICDALARLSRRRDAQVVYSLHPNPNINDPVRSQLGSLDRVTLLAPQSHAEFVHLMRRAAVVLTDSGGVQEEAPVLGKPVLVMRDRTERPEGVEAGAARLVGTDPDRIVAEVWRLLDDPAARKAMSAAPGLYGDGKAAPRILAGLRQFLDSQS